MIEKLEKHIIGENAPGTVPLMVAPTTEQQVDKINELVDAVNGILDYAPLEMAMKAEPETPAENVQPDAESRPVNVQDKFAEQRKWIGKLCKFWDIDNDNLYYGPLTKIHDTSPYCYECNHRICYAHCEPVKDDIIYKGGDNE